MQNVSRHLKHLPLGPPQEKEKDLSKDDSSRINSFFSTLRWQEAYELDAEGCIVSSNLEIVNVTGYEEREVIGKHFSLFYRDEDIELRKPQWDLATAANEGRVVIDGIKVKKKKIPFLSRFRISAHYDAVHRVSGYKLILTDLTQKAVYGHRFKKLKQEYQHLFENSCVGILKFHLDDSRIVLLNQYAEETLHVKAGAHLSLSFVEENAYTNLIRNLRISGYVDGFEIQIKTLNQRHPRWISIECKDLGFDGLVEAIFFDITTLKRNEEEMLRLRTELDSFIYSASHDLRSPISTVQGLLNLIDLVKNPEEIPTYTKMIKEKVGELDYLLKYLSTIASNNTTDILIEPIDLEAECRSVVKELKGKNDIVNVNIQVTATATFNSDLLRVRTILRNIISNSIKFTRPDVIPEITVRAVIERSKCTISIEDNGMGIEDVQLLKIYNLFYKGKNTKNGAGLGLYITKEMVDKLKGKIHVKSIFGNGTTFTIELPNV